MTLIKYEPKIRRREGHKRCERCGQWFIPSPRNPNRQIRCGSKKDKQGCSWAHWLERHPIYERIRIRKIRGTKKFRK